MDKSKLDLIIKVQLFAHRNNSTGVDAKKTTKAKKYVFTTLDFINCSN
jgi:hypothetical protein